MENMSLEGFTIVSRPKYALSLEGFHFESTIETQYGVVQCDTFISSLDIVQYGASDDGGATVHLENIVVKMSQDVFDAFFLPLPEAPNGLRYCSFDEFFGMDPGDFWVYDFKSQAFIDTKVFITDSPASLISAYMIEHNYNDDNYGSEWVALVADD